VVVCLARIAIYTLIDITKEKDVESELFLMKTDRQIHMTKQSPFLQLFCKTDQQIVKRD